MKRLALAVLLLAGLLLATHQLLHRGILRFNHPSFDRYPIQGIDVSHHQGVIDWPKVRGRRAAFVFIKATEGATFRDSQFTANWRAALSAGAVPGAYHFFTLCKPGAEQAENFLAVLPRDLSAALPPAVDLEFGGNCKRRPSVAEFQAELQEFLDKVEKGRGCRPVLYVTQEFYPAYVAGSFGSYPLWVRDIFRKPRLEDGRKWAFWQFANRGRLDGIDTFVDLNVFNGSARSFQELRCGASPLALLARPGRSA